MSLVSLTEGLACSVTLAHRCGPLAGVQTRLYVRVNFIAVCLVADKPGHSLMATVTVWTKPAALRRTCHGGRHTHDMAEVPTPSLLLQELIHENLPQNRN